MTSFCSFKIYSSLMGLLFLAPFGSTFGETDVWMRNTSIPIFNLSELTANIAETDTVFFSRSKLFPIALTDDIGIKKTRYLNTMDRRFNIETDFKESIGKNTSETPQKNGAFGAQMLRGYREMRGNRGYREMEENGHFFLDSELRNDVEEVLAYPNPAKDWIAIYLPDEITVSQILLHDMTGTVVKDWNALNQLSESGVAKITIENVSPGTYTLRVLSNNLVLKPIRILIKK